MLPNGTKYNVRNWLRGTWQTALGGLCYSQSTEFLGKTFLPSVFLLSGGESESCVLLRTKPVSYLHFEHLSLCADSVNGPQDLQCFLAFLQCGVCDPEGAFKIIAFISLILQATKQKPSEVLHKGSVSIPFCIHYVLCCTQSPQPYYSILGKDGGTAVLSEAMQPVSKALFIPGCVGDSKYLWKVINGLSPSLAFP